MTDEPKKKAWRVNFIMSREVEINDVTNAAEAEEKARDQVLFSDEPPIDRDDIDQIEVTWLDEEVGQRHLPKCEGNHCSHYDCSDEYHEDYHEYCYSCDPEQPDKDGDGDDAENA